MELNNVEPVDVEKVAEENPQSRFRIINAPIHKPGVCALCGSAGGDGRQFIDFGKTMDWYGVVYFCTFCIIEAGYLLGLHSTGASENLIAELQGRFESQKLQLDNALEQLNATRVLLRNCHCDDPDPVSDDSVPDAVVVEDSEESEGNSDDNTESTGVEEFGDIPTPPVDESSDEPKPKRTRRASSNS